MIDATVQGISTVGFFVFRLWVQELGTEDARRRAYSLCRRGVTEIAYSRQCFGGSKSHANMYMRIHILTT